MEQLVRQLPAGAGAYCAAVQQPDERRPISVARGRCEANARGQRRHVSRRQQSTESWDRVITISPPSRGCVVRRQSFAQHGVLLPPVTRSDLAMAIEQQL